METPVTRLGEHSLFCTLGLGLGGFGLEIMLGVLTY